MDREALGWRDPEPQSPRAAWFRNTRPLGGTISDHKAFGSRDLEEASGALFGVRAKTPRLSTWRLFLFLRLQCSDVDRQRLDWAAFFVRTLKRSLSRSLNRRPDAFQKEKGPARPHLGAGAGPSSVRRCTRVYALDRVHRYQPGRSMSTIYCIHTPKIGHILCIGKVMPSAIPRSHSESAQPRRQCANCADFTFRCDRIRRWNHRCPASS